MSDGFPTFHEFVVGDARDMPYSDNCVDLVVTSPPYPFISMWDEVYSELMGDDADLVEESIEAGHGKNAWLAMHDVLMRVWGECKRVLKPGGIACINIGDATRSIPDGFQLWDNRSRVVQAFRKLGFQQLPGIIWRKPTNSPNKFLGSGMLPVNAYVTLEHEHILIFRKGGNRSFDSHAKERRRESALLYGERNKLYSDLWDDVQGEGQTISGYEGRTAAYPVDIPHRLIRMFSIHQDVVLDPFAGTGTTSYAAALCGRSSVAVDVEEELIQHAIDRMQGVPEESEKRVNSRLMQHSTAAVEEDAMKDARYIEAPVKTKQEQNIRPYVATEASIRFDSTVEVQHKPYDTLRE